MGITRNLLVLLSLSTIAVWAAVDPSLEETLKDAEIPFVKNRYIIEVESISQSGFARRSENPHKRLYEDLRTRAVGFEINKEFDTPEVFVGVSLTLQNQEASDVSKLKGIDGVKAIRPVHVLQRPKPVSAKGVQSLEDLKSFNDTHSTHVMTGVDKLHNEGWSGKGISIGIIDTGIDYHHPALGAGFGPGFKVAGGYDFVGDDYTGSNAPVPDDDPLDECDGHGTHVAGIIGIDPLNNPFGLSGVAYEASLYSYRIFGCYGYVTEDIIIEGLLRAYNANHDILTLSLGATNGWTLSSMALVASRVAASGKVVTIAAGNEGLNGPWFTASPGSALGAISVASVDSVADGVINTLNVEGVQHDPIKYINNVIIPLPVTDSRPIYVPFKGTNHDGCNPYPDDTPDLSGYVVLVEMGDCGWGYQLIQNARAKGATALLYYEKTGWYDRRVYSDPLPIASIDYNDGLWLVKQFTEGTPVKLSFPQTGGSTEVPNPDGGLMSEWSTYGPTNDMYFKPALAAPGGNILSTYALAYRPYDILSGTSMATPFVAGSAALILQAKGKSADVARNVQTLLQTTANGLTSTHDSKSLLQTLAHQGAGLINVHKALHTTTLVSPGEFLLNDTAHFKKEHQFTVQNTGSTEQTYKVTHVPAGTAQTVQQNSIQVSISPVPLTSDFASVSFSESTFTLGAGQSKTLTATFTAPGGDKSRFPVYSGFVEVASNRDSLHISYMGLAASLKDKVLLDPTTDVVRPATPNINFGPFSEVQTGPKNYTFTSLDYPDLRMRITFGSPIVRLDWVPSTVTLDKRDEPTGPSFTFPKKLAASPVEIVGPYMEVDYLTRNSDYVDFSSLPANTFIIAPVFANGTIIPNGSYKMLLRVLRVTGDPNNPADYESWLSPTIGVQYNP